jgi:hypothetical protein
MTRVSLFDANAFPRQSGESIEEYQQRLREIYGEEYGEKMFRSYLRKFQRAEGDADVKISVEDEK